MLTLGAPVADVSLALNMVVENLLIIPILLALADTNRHAAGHWHLLAVMTWLVPVGDPQLKVALLLTGAMSMMGNDTILAQRQGHEGVASAALLVGTMASFFTLSGLLWLLRHGAGWLA